MRETKIRWDPEAYEFVASQAAYLGVSVAEFCRTATLFRATVTWTRHNPGKAAVMDTAVATAARNVLRAADPLEPG